MSECNHQWAETYYGTQCTLCGLFYPDGCAPWDDLGDYEDDDYDDEGAVDPYESSLSECGLTSIGLCTMAGSEYCEFECQMMEIEERISGRRQN